MVSLGLVLTAVALLTFSGVPALIFSKHKETGQRLTFFLMVLGSLAGLSGVLLNALGRGGVDFLTLKWLLPWGRFSVGLDPLANFFLTLVFLIPVLGSWYSLGYWKQSEHPTTGKRLGWVYGVLAGGMATVVIARDGVLFLLAWELMALAAFFAMTAEDDNKEVRKAGWVYLIATHIGTIFLLLMFGFWASETGTFDLRANSFSLEASSVIFILGVLGFGFKAGLMPLHFWLPDAHANAPSHVSAVMSGVMLKMGIYGILRMTSLLPVGAEWWGVSVLVAGVVTGILGIAFAMGQRDLKKLLAYSSIENIGIILMGVGLAFLGRFHSLGNLVLLGLGGALLHTWNHGLFKPLLFFNAGAVIHTTRTRDIDTMGGLGKKLPLTMSLFLLGSLAITGLPPLNGFISEWLIYLGLFQNLDSAVHSGMLAVASGAAGLALIGALSIAVFVKVSGGVFLGVNRGQPYDLNSSSKVSMLAPMVILGILCLGIGLGSPLLITILQGTISSWAGGPLAGPSLDVLAPSSWITLMGAGLLVLSGLGYAAFKLLPRTRTIRESITWDCGYAEPTSRMQYTPSSFTDTLTGLLGFVLKPKITGKPVEGIFPVKSNYLKTISDLVLKHWLQPLGIYAKSRFRKINRFQHGQTHLYIFYLLFASLVMFLIAGMWRPS